MIYEFNEINAPLIMSEFGEAKIVKCDLSKLCYDGDSKGVNVVYSVIDHGWKLGNFMVGIWDFEYIRRKINSVSLIATS